MPMSIDQYRLAQSLAYLADVPELDHAWAC